MVGAYVVLLWQRVRKAELNFDGKSRLFRPQPEIPDLEHPNASGKMLGMISIRMITVAGREAENRNGWIWIL